MTAGSKRSLSLPFQPYTVPSADLQPCQRKKSYRFWGLPLLFLLLFMNQQTKGFPFCILHFIGFGFLTGWDCSECLCWYRLLLSTTGCYCLPQVATLYHRLLYCSAPANFYDVFRHNVWTMFTLTRHVTIWANAQNTCNVCSSRMMKYCLCENMYFVCVLFIHLE